LVEEVTGGGAIRIGFGAGELDPLANAIVVLVQGIVGLSWLYSSSKEEVSENE